LRPTSQINPSSYLGRALRNVGKQSGGGGDPGDSSSEGSDASSSNSEDYWMQSLPSTHESDEEDVRRLKKRLSNKYNQYIARRKLAQTRLKPVPPEPYDGNADARVFHKFVMQAINYMDDGQVPRNKQVYRLADFLKGKAYEFYLSQVAYEPDKWTMEELLQEMFDFCFPVDYRSQQRLKLRNCRQGARRIKEFVFELQELSTMIGGVDQRELVTRLWYGCDKKIRAQLYLRNLHPEMSSFIEVAEAAEVTELALSAMDSGGTNEASKKSHSYDKIASKEKPTKKWFRNRDKPFRSKSVRSNSLQPKPQNSTGKQNKSKSKLVPKLSQKEWDGLFAAGKCFKCKELGHRAGNCPTGETVTLNAAKASSAKNLAMSDCYCDVK
jgi:hypothetical protein